MQKTLPVRELIVSAWESHGTRPSQLAKNDFSQFQRLLVLEIPEFLDSDCGDGSCSCFAYLTHQYDF